MKRTFTFLGEVTDEGVISHDRDDVRQWLLDMESAVSQLGGMVQMSAIRTQIGPDAYVTTGVIGVYDSYVPAQHPEPSEPVEDGV
jgi:hypothetical protein